AGRAGGQLRPPAGIRAAGADRLLELRRELPRRPTWTPRAVEQTRQRSASLLARLPPSVPPAVRRRGRNAEGGRGRLQRHPLLDRLHQGETAGQSELGVSVQIHPRPPLSVGPGRPTASKEGRIEPQPFTTSVGRTASYPDPAVSG